MMRYWILLCCALMAVSQAQAAPAAAEPAVWQLAQASRARISLDEAADLVQRRTGGRVLSAQAAQEGGREVYRIKVLTPNGEVRIVRVDAATGQME